MKPLRILLSIHHALDLDSGAPGTTLALGESLRELGQEVEYLSFDDMPVRLPDRLAKIAYPPFVAARLARVAGEFDVIDASLGDTWIWGRLSRRRRGPLLVCRSHGLEHLYYEATAAQEARAGRPLSLRYRLYGGRWRLHEVAAALRSADLVFVLNERERDYVSERLGVAARRVRVTANGVSARLLEAGRRRPTPEDTQTIAHIGQCRPMKGVAQGAAALTRVMRERPAVRVSFFGAGLPAQEVTEQFPADLRERISVTERYRRNDLPALLADQAILLFPSLSEGFGKVALEGMACGLAPVASDLSSMRWLIGEDENGLLVPPGDVDALEAALLRLLDDPELRRRLQIAARRRAESFSWDRIAQQRLDAYREVLTARGAA